MSMVIVTTVARCKERDPDDRILGGDYRVGLSLSDMTASVGILAMLILVSIILVQRIKA